MTTDIQTAARALMEAAERARTIRMREIEEQRIVCRAIVQGYDEARERLALLDAEYARVEAQSTADIARQALEPVQEQPQPEPYRAGLPPGTVCEAVGDEAEKAAEPSAAFVRRNCIPLIEQPATPPAPTLLDLTKLPPGTVCEATGEILTYLSGRRIKPGEMFRIVEPDDGMGDKHPTNIEIDFAGFVPALVPARVVKEGGGQ